MDDRQAIIELTTAYCWALDTRSWDDLDDVFTPTATAELGGTYSGIEAIKDRVSTVLTPLDASQHMVSTHQVRVDGDRATGRCYLQAQHVRSGRSWRAHAAGRRALRRPSSCGPADGWRIVDRVLTVVWTDGNPAVLGL